MKLGDICFIPVALNSLLFNAEYVVVGVAAPDPKSLLTHTRALVVRAPVDVTAVYWRAIIQLSRDR